MDDVCKVCGLPKNLCVCGEMQKVEQKIRVRRIDRKFGKTITTVSGLENEARAKELGKILKRKLACGGTVRENEIELQGDHVKRVKEVLLQEGYNEGLIDA
jgi:translation initiation factor 1